MDPRKLPVHFSNLKRMALSPLHYLHSLEAGVDETRAMRIGSAVHSLVLGGTTFHMFDGERRGKAWAEFKQDHDDGSPILTATEYDQAVRVKEAVAADPLAHRLLDHPDLDTEKLIYWDYCGRSCSSRLDAVTPETLIELKVTNSADPLRFPRQAIRMGYHAQLAFYNQALGRAATSPAFVIAVEDRPPHPVTVLQLTERALDYGDRLCRLWMERLLGCEATDEWPGYVQSVVPLDVWESDDQTLIIDGEEVAL